jgi:hypothetical protein
VSLRGRTARFRIQKAIKHRIEIGRLHPVFAGVYAVGRPELTRHGHWMAAALSCGPGAALSDESAAQLFDIRPYRSGPVEISVPIGRLPRHQGITSHRRKARIQIGHFDRIPVTSPIDTIIDLAPRLSRDGLETLRFSHGQIRYEPRCVETILGAVVANLAPGSGEERWPTSQSPSGTAPSRSAS